MVISGGLAGVASGMRMGATCSSTGTSTTAILASIFMRLCAWRALDALALEAVDKGLHMRARRFLLLGEGDVQRALGGARLHEGVVAAGVERELAPLQMQDEFGRRC